MSESLHEDEIPIDAALVRGLIDRALPDYSSLPLERLSVSGSSNALFRLGADFLVRLPRQPGGTATIEKEARWLPQIASHMRVDVPEIVFLGSPDLGYPERWSVVRWVDGAIPTPISPEQPGQGSRHQLAGDLAELVVAIREIEVPTAARDDAELSWYRGEPLISMDESTRRYLSACRSIPDFGLDVDEMTAMWEEAMALPGVDEMRSPTWYHGDLLGENLLAKEGRLSGVLDFGGLGVGDATVDLIPAWELLDPFARAVFREAVGVDEAEWLRGRAWALAIAIMTFPYYWDTMPTRCESRLAIAKSVLSDTG